MEVEECLERIMIQRPMISSNYADFIGDIETYSKKYGEVFEIYFDELKLIMIDNDIKVKDIYYNWELERSEKTLLVTTFQYVFLIFYEDKQWYLTILKPYTTYQLNEDILYFKHNFDADNKCKLILNKLNDTIDTIPTTTIVTSSLGNIITNIISRALLNPISLTGLITNSIFSSLTGTLIGFTVGPYISSIIFPNKPTVKTTVTEIVQGLSGSNPISKLNIFK